MPWRGYPDAPPVLLYHGFGSRPRQADPFGLFVPTDSFERQLRLLVRHFHPLDLSEYLAALERQSWRSRSFLLTIDDGYVSTFDQAAPLLARYRVPAVLFVPPGLLGQRSAWMPDMPGERLLTREQLAQLSDLGIEVGVHGMDHAPLIGLSPSQARTQIWESREILGGILGYKPRSFAYPEGKFDEQTVNAVRSAGYEVGFSVQRGGAGRFTMARRGINRSDSLISFAARLMPWYEPARRVSARHPALRRLAGLVAPARPTA
jgi:peptidoglycan/xylan/chitin deacetylase (PgdA/CDA1 family)